jgi:TRAP-type transport system small permease protein
MLEKTIGVICNVVLWMTTVVIFMILSVKTIMRYATGNDLDWGNEVPELLFPWLVMSGVVLAALHGSHITTAFLRDRFSPTQQRFLSMFVWSVVAILYAVLIVATFKMLPLVHAEKSPILGVPNSVTFGCVMLGMIGLFALAVKDLITTIKTPASQVSSTSAPNTHY